jgi:uroporphyrinogen-III decarboxylase
MKEIRHAKSDINRLLKAFNCQKGDRVPYFDVQHDSRIVDAVLGRKIGYTTNGLDMNVNDHIEFALKIGMDAVGIGVYYSPGRVHQKAEDGTLHYIDGSIKNRADISLLDDPKEHWWQKGLEKVARLKDAAKGTGLGIWAYVHGPFDPVYLAMGLNDFSMMLFDDSAFIELLMDRMLDVQCKIVEELVKIGVDFVHVGDDVCTGTGLFVSPDVFMKMYPPRLRRLIKPAKDKSMPVTFHSDGKIDRIVPILTDAGICAMHPIEPYSNDIYEVKKLVGSRITLMGNISLTQRSPQEIRNNVKGHIEKLADGGYVLTSSHTVTNDVTFENFVAMVEANYDFGAY